MLFTCIAIALGYVSLSYLWNIISIEVPLLSVIEDM